MKTHPASITEQSCDQKKCPTRSSSLLLRVYSNKWLTQVAVSCHFKRRQGWVERHNQSPSKACVISKTSHDFGCQPIQGTIDLGSIKVWGSQLRKWHWICHRMYLFEKEAPRWDTLWIVGYLLIIQGNKCKFSQVCRLKKNTVGIFHCFACLLTVYIMGWWLKRVDSRTTLLGFAIYCVNFM